MYDKRYEGTLSLQALFIAVHVQISCDYFSLVDEYNSDSIFLYLLEVAAIH